VSIGDGHRRGRYKDAPVTGPNCRDMLWPVTASLSAMTGNALCHVIDQS